MKGKFSDFYYSISMKKKWAIFICVIIIYEMVLIGYFGYKNYEKVIGDYFIEGVQKDVSNVTEQVGEKLKGLEDFASKLQYDEYIYSFIQEKEYSARKGDLGSIPYKSIPEYKFKRDVEKHLNSVLLSRPEIKLASIQFLKDPDKIYTVTRNKSYAEELSFGEMAIYERKLEKASDTQYFIDNKKDLYIVQKIASRGTFQHSANIVLKIEKKMVLKKLEDILEGPKKGVYVVGFDHKEILQTGEVSAGHKYKVLNYFNEMKLPGMYPGDNPKKEIIVYDELMKANKQIHIRMID